MTADARRKAHPVLAELGSVPRDVALTGRGKALAILAPCLAIAALGLGVWLSTLHVRQLRDRELRSRDAVLTNGEVVRVTRTRDKHPRQVVTYRFSDADGGSHVGSIRLGEDEPLQRFAGDMISIAYLRSDAERNWMSGHEPDVMPLWVAPVVSAALAAVTWLMIWRLRRDWRLLSEGRAAEARVVATKRVTRQHQSATRVNYEFTTIAGATVEGHQELGRRPPAVGDRVIVVYHRDDPHWNALYPLPLVKPARR